MRKKSNSPLDKKTTVDYIFGHCVEKTLGKKMILNGKNYNNTWGWRWRIPAGAGVVVP